MNEQEEGVYGGTRRESLLRSKEKEFMMELGKRVYEVTRRRSL